MLNERRKIKCGRAIADPLVRLNNETIANQLQPLEELRENKRAAEDFSYCANFYLREGKTFFVVVGKA